MIDAPEPVRQGVTRQRSPLWLRRGGVALAVTIAALVATCTDHPTEPLLRGGRVLLAVRPLLQSPVKLQAFGLTIDKLRLIAVHPPSDTAADTTLAFPSDSSGLHITLDLLLHQQVETLVVHIQMLAGTRLLFAGLDTAIVSVGGTPDTTSTATVPLSYVGPGAGIDKLHVLPIDSVVTLGSTLGFRVTAESLGVAVDSFYVSWSTTDTSLAPINAFGLLHAPSARGKVYVRAVTPTGVKDSTPITFVPVPTTLAIVSGSGQSGAVGTALGAALRVRVTALDALGVKGIPVSFSVLTGGGSVTSATVVTDSLGFAQTTATLGTTLGSQTFQASAGGLTPVTFTQTAIAGPISATTSTVSVSSGTAGSGVPVTLTLQGKDALGNNVSIGGATVVFSTVGGTSTGSIGGVTDNANGTYTATFTGILAGTATTIHATVNGTALGTALPTITVTPGVISAATSTVSVSAGTVQSGLGVTLTVQGKDAAGNSLTTGGATVVFSAAGGTSTGTIGATTDNGNGSYTATFTGILVGTADTIHATINATPVGTALPTVAVIPGAISAATSLVSVSSGSVTSGAGVTLTLTGKDAAGNALTAGGATVAFTNSGGTSTGTISSTTDNANGTYTATFTGLVAGTATNIGATINATPVSTALPTVTVTPGLISAVTSTVTVSSGSILSGATSTLTLHAKDAAGNILSTGGAIVAFSRLGGTSTGTIGSTTDNGDGTYTAIFTGVTAGSATAIHATIGATPVSTAAPSITVNPGPISAAASVVSVSSGSILSGGTSTLTLQAKDAAGNLITTGGATVAFTSSSGGGISTGSIAPSPATDNGDGTYTATFTGILSGTPTTIGATINATPVSTVLPQITVTAGAASATTSVVSVSSGTIISGGTVTLTLQAKDAAGNSLTTGGAAVVFSTNGGSSTGTIAPSPATDNGNGTYTSIFTGVTAGSATQIRATVNATTVGTAPPTITVTVGTIAATTSVISVSSGTILSGATSTLTLQAKDAAGNNLSSGGATVAFIRSGGTSTGTIGATTDNGNGTYSATFTGVTAGSPTNIGATINATPVSTAAPTITVTAGAISTATSVVTTSSGTLASGAQATLTLQAKDAAGNNLASGGATVVFSFSGGTSTGTIGATTDNGNGTYTATFTGVVAGTATTIGATINAAPATSTKTITVVPGNTSSAHSIITVSAASLASGGTDTLRLQVKDSAGNNVTTGGANVVFSASGGTSTGTIAPSPATDNGNGTYTAIFTPVVAGTATTIGATLNGAAITSTLPTVTVTAGAASAATSVVSVSSGTVASGAGVTLTLQAKDAAGNNLTTGGATVVFTATGGTSTGSVGATTDNGNGTYTATFSGIAAGTATTIHATLNGTAVATALPTVTVTAGVASAVTSVISVSTGSVLSGATSTLTLQAKDAAGNNLSAGGATVVFSHAGGTSTGTIVPSPATDNGNGTYTATFTGLVAGSATTIGATLNGTAVSTALPTITVSAGAVSAATSVVSVSSASILSGTGDTLKLQARDAAGNNLTTGGATVVFDTAGGTSTGSIGATVDNGNGTYYAIFSGVAAGTAKTIGATVNGTPVTTALPTVTVTPGLASAATSLVTVSSGTLASGAGVTLTLRAKDAAGNNLTAGGATVVFSDSGGTSTGTISATTDNGDGTYIATFTGVVAGTATTIHATLNGAPVVTALPTVTVTAGATATVVVAPDTATLVALGNTKAFTATAKDASGNVVAGETFTWTTSNAAFATVNAASGVATAVGDGVATITATSSNTKTGTATLTVAQVVTQVAVIPALDTIHALGNSRVFAAVAKDVNDSVVPGATFTWTSSDTLVAKVNAAGSALAVAAGSDTITATTSGISGKAVLVVHQVVASVKVTPDTVTLTTLGLTHQFTAQAFDSNTNVVPGQSFTWTTSNALIATVNASGLATATGVGIDTIKATTAGVTGHGLLTVLNATHAADITADETWFAAASPHIVTAYIRVRNGATLTIENGATVKFAAGAGLQVGDTALGQTGGLVMQGSPAAIHLTADTTIPFPGFWKGVEVQRSLPVAPWKNVDIEWAGGNRPIAFNEACVLIANNQGAALDLDSLKIHQCFNGGIHLYGGTAHVHGSQVDTVTGSGIHAHYDATLELDSSVIRGAGQEGLLLGTPTVHLLPSSANQFRNNGVVGIHLRAEQLPGLLVQDSLVGNGSDAIAVDGGIPDPTAPVVTLFHQPRPAGADYHVSNGLLNVGRIGGQELVLDSNLTVGFDAGTGVVVGDSAGTRSGTIRSLATRRAAAPKLLSFSSAVPGSWVGVELGRLSGPDTIRNLEIQYAGDSLPGRTVHRGGLWVRSPVAVPLVLDSLNIFGNGSSGAVQNSGGAIFTAPVSSVEVLHSNIASNPGYGIVTPDRGFKVVGNSVQGNGTGLGTFTQGGTQLTAADSIAGNSYVGNGHAVSLSVASLRAFYDTVIPANLSDTLLLFGGSLTANARLPRVPGFVWHVTGAIAVDSNATFTIAAGDTVTFDTLAVLGGPGIPAFVQGFPSLPAAITIGGLQPGALAAVGTAANPILLTSSVPGRGWAGIQWVKPQGVVDVTNNVFNFVTVDRAGFYAPCFGDCNPIPFSALRLEDTTNVVLTFDHVIVRGSSAFGLDFERFGTGTLLISNSQIYNNAGGIRAQSGHGNQLTITGSDLYNYRGSVIDAIYGGADSVNADGNWWGDVAGPNPGFNFSDSLGRGAFNGTGVRAANPAGAPFFPVGPAARLIAARDTFLTTDTVLSIAGQSDSLRVRAVDAEGRGVAGVPVSWATTSGIVTPGPGASDLGGRVSAFWVTGSVAGLQNTTANGIGGPVVFPLDLLPGNTNPVTVDWVVFQPATVAESVYTHASVGTDTIVYLSSNHASAFVTHARDFHGNVTHPNVGPLFDQGPCSGFVCRFPAADSVRGDTVFFRPPVIGTYVISGEYESGLGGTDQIVLRVKPVAAGIRIDRDVFTSGIQDTGKFTFNSQCRFGAPVNSYCAGQFNAYVVDSGGADMGATAASFNWVTPGGDTTVTLDSIRGPANDFAFISAHADGPTYLVAVDINDVSPTFNQRDSMPVIVDQRPAFIALNPLSASLRHGDSVVFTAKVTDQGGDTMPTKVVHWRVDPLIYPGLTILDTSVVNQVKVRLDSGSNTQVTAVTCCTTAQPPFDTLFENASVTNPAQVSVSVGTSPGDVSVNPVTKRAYVGLFTDSIAVVDLNSDALLTRIHVGNPTYWTGVNTATNRVYAGSNVGVVYAIDGFANAVVDSFTIGAPAPVAQMAVDEVHNRLYVPLSGPYLGVVDGITLARIDSVFILHPGAATAYNPNLNRIYVATPTGTTDTVRVIDATSLAVVDSIPVGVGVFAIAVNPVTGKVYVTNASDQTVTVIDGNTDAVLTTITLGFQTPQDIAIDTVANLVYVAESGNLFHLVIDGATDATVESILLDSYTSGVGAMPGRGPVVYTEPGLNAVRILHF